jgi:ribosomal subunit interface protein
MNIIFKGRRTDVQERFRQHASAKLGKLEKLDSKAIRVDVEVSQERNPRQADRRERVELTIRSRGPVIRAEAAADDRYAALDRALAKLEERLRRTLGRRKASRHGPPPAAQAASVPVTATGPPRAGWAAGTAEDAAGERAEAPVPETGGAGAGEAAGVAAGGGAPLDGGPPGGQEGAGPGENGRTDFVPIQMEGDGPVVVREKFHPGKPISVDQALLQMELVGHDFYLFRDERCGLPSVVYRRHGYHYGLIRLVETATREDVTAGLGRHG